MISRLCNNFVTPRIWVQVRSREVRHSTNATPEETVSFAFTGLAEREAASSFTFGWDLMRYVATGAPTNCPSIGCGP